MTTVLSQNLDGAVALVTGAGGDIGNATCAALAAAGARVVATDIADAKDPPFDSWHKHDVSSSEDWTRVIEEVRKKYGRLDCLVNSAGICPIETLEKTSLDQFRRVFAINVESILIGIQTALPLLKESGKDRQGGSSIVNLASVSGIRGVVLGTAYCSSKGAVTLLTKTAAKEFAAFKYPIRVNSVHPGSIDGAMMDINLRRFVETGLAPSFEEARANSEKGRPMGRMGRPEEIAAGVAFLCSPASSFMTGAEFVIDGGSTC